MISFCGFEHNRSVDRFFDIFTTKNKTKIPFLFLFYFFLLQGFYCERLYGNKLLLIYYFIWLYYFICIIIYFIIFITFITFFCFGHVIL